MEMISEYVCTRCKAPTKRDELLVKRVAFVKMGPGAKTVRSRVTDWLCSTCISKDADYNREAFKVPVSRNG